MVWTRRTLTLGFGLGLGLGSLGCGDDGTPSQTSQSTTDDTADTGTPDDTGTPTGGPVDCVSGQLGCTCPCVGGTYCVDEVCVLGPDIDIGDDRSVLPGVIVPHEVGVMADEFSWTQESGPPVEILGGNTLNIAVPVPPDAAPGEAIRLRLSATRNGVTIEQTWQVSVRDTVFEDALPEISDPAQLGTTEGLAFGPQGMYVVSTEGFVSVFDGDGQFLTSHDVGGAPAGASFMDEDLIIANAGLGSVQRLNSVSGSVSALFDAGAEVNFPLIDRNGDFSDVYVSTRIDQTVLFYDGELGSTSVFLEDPGVVNPNALAFGPEGNSIYVGAVGHVWRVPLIDGGGAGEPEDYLDLGDDTCEVDGLVFDEGNNLWVGCPALGTLFVAHYSGDGPTQISRGFDGPANLSGFVNLRFGRGDFDDESLYYSNLGSGTVGRLRVGLGD